MPGRARYTNESPLTSPPLWEEEGLSGRTGASWLPGDQSPPLPPPEVPQTLLPCGTQSPSLPPPASPWPRQLVRGRPVGLRKTCKMAICSVPPACLLKRNAQQRSYLELFFKKINKINFIDLFLAVLGLRCHVGFSLAVGSGGCLVLQRVGFSSCGSSCCRAQALGRSGVSSSGVWPQSFGHTGLVALGHGGSSRTRD